MFPKPLTSAQIRAARALLRWSALQLAEKSAVGVTTIRRAELTASETNSPRSLIRSSAAPWRRQVWSSWCRRVTGRECGCGYRNRKAIKRHD